MGTGLRERKGRCVGLVPSFWTVTAPMGDQAESEKQDRRLSDPLGGQLAYRGSLGV